MAVRARCWLVNAGNNPVEFLLNRQMQISRLCVDGREVEHSEMLKERPYEAKYVTWSQAPKVFSASTMEVECHCWCEAGDSGPEAADWIGIIAIRPDEFRVSPQSFWYPVFQATERTMDYCRAPADIRVTVADLFSVMATGNLLEVIEGIGKKTHVWKTNNCCQYSIFGRAAPFVTIDNGGPCYRLLLTENNVRLRDPLGALVVSVRSYFEKILGKPAHEEAGLAEMTIRSRHSYNYCTNNYVVLANRLLDKMADRLSLRVVSIIAHEIAHWWFPGTTGACGDSSRFLNEGIAEYLARRYIGSRYGRAIEGLLYLKDARKCGGSNFQLPHRSDGRLAYSKAPWIWRMLNDHLSMERLLAVICQDYRESSFSEEEFWAVAQKLSMGNLDEFKRYWWCGSSVPSITYDYRYYPSTQDKCRVDILINCDTDILPCDIVIEIVAIHETKRLMYQLPSATGISTEVVGPIRSISVDPDTKVLAIRMPRLGELLATLRSLLCMMNNLRNEDICELDLHLIEISRCIGAILLCCNHGVAESMGGPPPDVAYLAKDWCKTMRPESNSELIPSLGQLYETVAQIRGMACGAACEAAAREMAGQLRTLIECLEESRKTVVEWDGMF